MPPPCTPARLALGVASAMGVASHPGRWWSLVGGGVDLGVEDAHVSLGRLCAMGMGCGRSALCVSVSVSV